MHIALPLKDGTVLMATDACEPMGFKLNVGNNFHIAIETESEDESMESCKKLSAGGSVEMQPKKMFWGAFFGSWVDQFGVRWMVNYTYPR